MSKAVDLDRLAELLGGYGFAFLITVDDAHRAHTTTITPTYTAGVFDVGPMGRHGRANLTDRDGVTLLFPARRVYDYSLIVDGRAALPDDPAGPVLVTPTKALLHRPAFEPDSERAVGTVHDCVQLKQA